MLAALALISCSDCNNCNQSTFSGPYLGQTPPREQAELFGRGLFLLLFTAEILQ